MTRIAMAVILALASLCGFLGWRTSREHARGDAFDQQLADQRIETARAQARADSLTGVYRTDTLVLRRTLTRWDTVKAGLDTIRDTIRVPIEVVRTIVASADTAIAACTLALRTCESRIAAERTITTSVRAELGTVTDERDHWRTEATRRRWLSCGAGLVATLDVGRLVAAPGLACVVPLFSH